MMYAWQRWRMRGIRAEFIGEQDRDFCGDDDSGYGELLAQAQRGIDGYSSTGSVSSVGREPDELFFECARAERTDRDGVFEFAGGAASSGACVAERRLRDGLVGGIQHDLNAVGAH